MSGWAKSRWTALLVSLAAALLFPYELAAQNAPPPPKELGEDSFVGVWVDVDERLVLLIEYAGDHLRINEFACKESTPLGTYKAYPAKAGTIVGDLCLGRVRPKGSSGLDSVYVWEIDSYEGHVRGKDLYGSRDGLNLEMMPGGIHAKSFTPPWRWYYFYDFVRVGAALEKWRASDFDALFGKPKAIAKPAGGKKP